MKVLVAGDFCPYDRVTDLIEKEQYDNIFNKVKDIVTTADYSILNFECPVVENEASPIVKAGPHLRCTSKSIDAVKYMGFGCCTLANNHFADYGEVGIEDTLRMLKEKQIDVVGGGHNLAEAQQILYKQIGEQTLAIINCCEHEFSIATHHTGGSNPLNPISQYYAIVEARNKADKVMVIVHGGHEMYQLPSPRMKEIYHFFIDVGADVVVNHHQHCYSGYEEYNDGLVFYGLGNFCFDRLGIRNSIWNEGYMVTIDFSGEKASFMIHPYIQCGDEPKLRMMSRREEADFKENIKRINEIIIDDASLNADYELFRKNTADRYILALEPYDNRYLQSLYRRGLLPSFLTKKKKLQLQNYLLCESHYERLVYAVTLSLVNKKNNT